MQRKENENTSNRLGENSLQSMYLIKDLYPKNIKNSQIIRKRLNKRKQKQKQNPTQKKAKALNKPFTKEDL